MRVWMVAAGAALALCGGGQAHAQADREAAFQRVLRQSSECLIREVSSRVDAATVTLGDTERAAVRAATADACYIYNAQLARFTREVHEGTRSLEDVTAAMQDGSLQLADQLIGERLAENAARRK
jgi:hypothetical protein